MKGPKAGEAGNNGWTSRWHWLSGSFMVMAGLVAHVMAEPLLSTSSLLAQKAAVAAPRAAGTWRLQALMRLGKHTSCSSHQMAPCAHGWAWARPPACACTSEPSGRAYGVLGPLCRSSSTIMVFTMAGGTVQNMGTYPAAWAARMCAQVPQSCGVLDGLQPWRRSPLHLYSWTRCIGSRSPPSTPRPATWCASCLTGWLDIQRHPVRTCT